MIKRPWFLLVVVALLGWSYFARPIYDFAQISAGRVIDVVSSKTGPKLLTRDRQGVVDTAMAQGDEIEAYLKARRTAPLDASQALDFSSPMGYQRSADVQRAALRTSLRFPPPGFEPAATGPVKEALLGEDELATYRELQIPVLPGVHATGLLLLPKSAGGKGKLPLVVAAHGRGGAPETTPDGKLGVVSAYSRDLAWDALRRGYAVWLPHYTHYGKTGDNFREHLTTQAWEAGTSLPAIEIAKTIRAIDVLIQRPDIDAARVAMMGVSYGGFYTLYTTALDPRIRVAVVAAYFNDRETVLDASGPHGFLDWRFPDSLSRWRDPSVAALVAPRPLLIEAGNQDQLFPIAGARRAAPLVADVYQRLGVPDRFRFREFVGRHDFEGAEAIDFIDRYLRPGDTAAK